MRTPIFARSRTPGWNLPNSYSGGVTSGRAFLTSSNGTPRGNMMTKGNTLHTITGRSAFPTTRWTTVVAAGDPQRKEARSALVSLCETYWYPLYAYLRRRGYPPDEAQDLTQEFFIRL